MSNLYEKIEVAPTGFILQKDVYTTNLLYSYDQFPLKALRSRLPFRPKKKENPNYSVQILRENGNISDFTENKRYFYSFNSFKPKLLKNRKLFFPLPKKRIYSLNNLNYYEEISKKNLQIKNIDDDLNITSNNGRKIYYKFKETNSFKGKKDLLPMIPLTYSRKKRKQGSLTNVSMKNKIERLNDELKIIKKIESHRKKSFVRDKFFNTQIYINNIIEKNE